MIPIDKDEAQTIRKVYPNVSIVRTCVQKSKRKHYYVEEQYFVLKLLEELRNPKIDSRKV